jgi:hypothetical protein
MKINFLPIVFLATTFGFVSCHQSSVFVDESRKIPVENGSSLLPEASSNVSAKLVADAATILARKEVPVLCYHQIRDWNSGDSKSAKDIIVPVSLFKQHLKMLADSGYHTILPDQLYDYLATGAPLPEKPVMLTYDDADDDQFNIAAPEMKKYGFKGVFFIMTVSINHSIYLKREQIKQLSDEGNVIASHTWDHHKSTGYKT